MLTAPTCPTIEDLRAAARQDLVVDYAKKWIIGAAVIIVSTGEHVYFVTFRRLRLIANVPMVGPVIAVNMILMNARVWLIFVDRLTLRAKIYVEASTAIVRWIVQEADVKFQP